MPMEESALRVRLHDSPHVHATQLSRERRVWSACGRIVSTLTAGDEILGNAPAVTCRTCLRVIGQCAEPFWPPRVGDVWLGQLGEPSPKAWVCHTVGMLAGVHNWTADEAWKQFGPLRLVWRDGAPVEAPSRHAGVNAHA